MRRKRNSNRAACGAKPEKCAKLPGNGSADSGKPGRGALSRPLRATTGKSGRKGIAAARAVHYNRPRRAGHRHLFTKQEDDFMALETKKELRNQVLYSVFVRQYSREGTFRAVQADLGRIRALGVDVIWLLPIHPIGEAKRKGTLGSPYAIRDYRAVNPEFGTREDFCALVDGDPRPRHEVHHRRGVQPHLARFLAGAKPSRVVLPQGGRLLRQQERRLDGHHRPRLRPAGAVGLPDRNAPAVGADRGRLPLRRGAAGAAGLLAAGAPGGRGRAPRLPVAERIRGAGVYPRQPGARHSLPVGQRRSSRRSI
jgi:hypothetical protein